MNEQRKYRRARIGVKFIYKVMGVKGEITVSSADLGGGGLRFYLDKKVKPGTLVELGICLTREKEIFFTLGKVAWQQEVMTKYRDERKGFATGVEFLKLDTTNKLRLMRFVHDKIKEAENEE